MTSKYTDTPIEQIEDDRFGFGSYALTLAERIKKADTPLTIGVFGRWGEGKSSLMKMLQHKLQEPSPGKKDRRVTIWINVWQMSNQEEVWQAFLQALFGQINRRLSLWQRINKMKLAAQLAKNSLRIFIVITPLILGQFIGSQAGWDEVISLAVARGGTLTTIGLAIWVITRAQPIVEAAHETVNFDVREILNQAPYEAQITALQQLNEQFQGMVTSLVKKGERLTVFIDDLDRCTPDKIPEILEAIKLFTTSEHCIYVLGLDHDIVRQSVMKKYKFDDEQATEYLEKIIQIPFHLPPLDRDKIAYFVRLDYPDLCKECPYIPEIFALGLEPNPRKVKRALHIYRTLLDLVRVRVQDGEIEPLEPQLLAKMVVIQLHFRPLYKALIRDPSLFKDLEIWARVYRYPKQPIGLPEEKIEMARARIEKCTDGSGEPQVRAEARSALAAMLVEAGPQYFGDLDLETLADYIHLTGRVTSEKFAFERSTSLTPTLKGKLEAALSSFIKYFEELGFKAPRTGRIRIAVEPDVYSYAIYYPVENTIQIDEKVAGDPDMVLKKYADYVLFSSLETSMSSSQARAFEGIETGLADYFTCSFNDSPLLGEIAGMQLSLRTPYVRKLDTDRKFSELTPEADKWNVGGVWGGVFWELRQKLGQTFADRLLFLSWKALKPNDAKDNVDSIFAKKLLEVGKTAKDGQNLEQIRTILVGRGLRLDQNADTSADQKIGRAL